MITASSAITSMINSRVRKFVAEVELYKGSTLVDTFKHNDRLVNFSIERVTEENKFFGAGICQHLKVTILDKEREIDYIDTTYTMKVKIGIESELMSPFPTFYVTQTRRDENTNALSIYGYDLIKKASQEKIGDYVDVTAKQTVQEFAEAMGAAIGATSVVERIANTYDNSYKTTLSSGVNFDGSELVREALNDIAEVTQTFYYVNYEDKLIFTRPRKDYTDTKIDKSKYFTLETRPNKRLGKIYHTTVLGDNLYATNGTGTTQFVRDNAIWSKASSVQTLLQNAANRYGGITFAQFDCYWRGNFLLEIGDRIEFINKENESIYGYLLDDVIEYDGTLSQKTKWNYNDDTNEDGGGNPVTLGEIINQTYALVDKAAGEIELVSKRADELSEDIGSLTVTANGISSRVSKLEKNNTQINSDISSIEQTASSITSTVQQLQGDVTELESQIEQTAESINLKVSKNEVISAINLSPESVNISSDKIDLNGYVTFTDLAGNGTTTINGSNIKTGTISADRINMTGAISWGDLDSNCQNTIFLIADAYGGDASVPDYIKSTYIDSVRIMSPTIQGGTISAGTNSEGYVQMSSTGLVFRIPAKQLIGMGYYPGRYNYPYIIFGAGVDEYGTDTGMIKKYADGMWIGDNDAQLSETPSGTGIFIDTTHSKIYKYINGVRTEL